MDDFRGVHILPGSVVAAYVGGQMTEARVLRLSDEGVLAQEMGRDDLDPDFLLNPENLVVIGYNENGRQRLITYGWECEGDTWSHRSRGQGPCSYEEASALQAAADSAAARAK